MLIRRIILWSFRKYFTCVCWYFTRRTSASSESTFPEVSRGDLLVNCGVALHPGRLGEFKSVLHHLSDCQLGTHVFCPANIGRLAEQIVCCQQSAIHVERSCDLVARIAQAAQSHQQMARVRPHRTDHGIQSFRVVHGSDPTVHDGFVRRVRHGDVIPDVFLLWRTSSVRTLGCRFVYESEKFTCRSSSVSIKGVSR